MVYDLSTVFDKCINYVKTFAKNEIINCIDYIDNLPTTSERE